MCSNGNLYCFAPKQSGGTITLLPYVDDKVVATALLFTQWLKKKKKKKKQPDSPFQLPWS